MRNWHLGDNLRWLADNKGAAYLPCGMLHGLFLTTVADRLEQLAQGIDARERQDREAGPDPKGESPVAESDAPKGDQ